MSISSNTPAAVYNLFRKEERDDIGAGASVGALMSGTLGEVLDWLREKPESVRADLYVAVTTLSLLI